MRMTPKECSEKFGPIENGQWELSAYWCIMLMVPSKISAKLINSATGAPCIHIYCNKDMAPALLRAFQNVEDRGLLGELETFDGCYSVRQIRGADGPSAHSWAMAIDLNAKQNPLGGPVRFSEQFRQCFEDAGFVCGADFKRQDGMHFSYTGF